MKYCTKCGKPLASDERFCTNCGTENKHYHEFSRSEILHTKPSVPFWKVLLWILVSLIGLALIVGAAYFAFQFYSGGNESKSESSSQVTKKEDTSKHLPNTHKISVNVNSNGFSRNYMKAPNTEGYQGFEIGKSQADILQTFGKSEGTKNINGNKVYLYGDVGVSYDHDDKVEHVFVVPHQVSESEFTAFHNQPDETRGDTWYYDSNKNNGFSIKVYTKDGNIEAIENIPQI